MNAYELLGVLPNASPDDIKAAYRARAQACHPDRFVGQQRVEAERRYRELSEAFNSLQQAQPGTPEPPQIQLDHAENRAPQQKSPSDYIQEAKAAFDAKNYEKCASLAQAAIALDGEQATYHSLLALALDKGDGDKRTKVNALENAIRLDPKDVEAVILLAQTFQALGMHAKASRLWGKVSDLAPNHPIFAPPPRQSGDTIHELGERVHSLFADVQVAAGRIFNKK